MKLNKKVKFLIILVDILLLALLVCLIFAMQNNSDSTNNEIDKVIQISPISQQVSNLNKNEIKTSKNIEETENTTKIEIEPEPETNAEPKKIEPATPKEVKEKTENNSNKTENKKGITTKKISLSSDYKYAENSKINTGTAILYENNNENKKNKVICVNAGHGTSGGDSQKTLCHPDGSPKVTSGSTAAGSTYATAVSSGMTFSDGTPESKITLATAILFKDKLLAEGYSVLMIRENNDVQLDNIARTVIANNNADCHIALHWDSTTSDKGAFYISVPNVGSYRSMEPVASHWKEHHSLGESLISGLKSNGVKIHGDGKMAIDLTQTSYSTIPSIDIELGDKGSDISNSNLSKLADGLVNGVNIMFGY